MNIHDDTFIAVVQGDVALVADHFDEGYATSIYRRRGGRWRWIADKGNSPGPCLFELAHVGAADARKLEDDLLRAAPGLKLDVEYDGCRTRPLYGPGARLPAPHL